MFAATARATEMGTHGSLRKFKNEVGLATSLKDRLKTSSKSRVRL